MYSHYAKDHTGVCLQFLVTNNEFYDALFPIHYANEFPQLKFTELDDDLTPLLKAELLWKSIHWAYEKEWRIIKVEGERMYKFPEEILTGIILGIQASEEGRKDVIAALRARKTPTQLFEARKQQGRFGVDVVCGELIGR
jgi:hypothetical protein